MKFIKRYYWVFLSVALILLDQLTKWLVSDKIAINESIVLITDFFSLTHVRNTGAAFGIFAGHRWVFLVFSSIVLIAALALLLSKKIKSHWGIVATALILAGGAGNMIDRIFLGEVIDFFAFNFWGYEFAVFNVADIFVCCGTFLLAFYILTTKDFDSPKKQEETVDGEN
ncbi:MAG: signal peptidase II [Clostridia bacterium]|nr:signal peptidase II [Clostridia bacterium]